jgi:hypothetical protein
LHLLIDTGPVISYNDNALYQAGITLIVEWQARANQVIKVGFQGLGVV